MVAQRDGRREGRTQDGLSEMHRKRRGRNIALLVVLSALVVLFYVLAIVKIGGQS